MPRNQVSDLIKDNETAFAQRILSGAMTDGRAAMHERPVQQQTEELRRLNLNRKRVLDRLWEIANLDIELTRNSANAQIKALSMIIALDGLIPDRRPGSAQNKSAQPPLNSEIDTARLREQQGTTDPIVASPLSPAETSPSAPQALVPASATDNRVPSSLEKKPDTLRLRL
jgi:hypothetical protein